MPLPIMNLAQPMMLKWRWSGHKKRTNMMKDEGDLTFSNYVHALLSDSEQKQRGRIKIHTGGNGEREKINPGRVKFTFHSPNEM